MNVGWIFPHRKRCGINRYSLDYINALSTHVNVIPIDPRWWNEQRSTFLSLVQKCTLLHVQYETSLFLSRNRFDYYSRMIKKTSLPVAVSLHEVYENNPGVFPRSHIKGFFPLRRIRTFMYDFRHPVQSAFSRHLKKSFHAHRILVHHKYHTDILKKKGVNAELIRVLPHPVVTTGSAPFKPLQSASIHLGAQGYVNPQYNYDLLFSVLDQMDRAWMFTWIGGVRSSDQRPLLDDLLNRIHRRNWQKRFIITGWVPESDIYRKLIAVDCILALFKTRSSSGSLARVLGAGKPVIATDIPLTSEIAHYTAYLNAPAPIMLSGSSCTDVISTIERLFSDPTLQEKLNEGLHAYCEAVSFPRMAEQLSTLYRELVQP